MKSKRMIYPIIDEKRETQIAVSSERLLYGEAEYYFSPKFKQSPEILEGILKGYITKKGKFQKLLADQDLVICYDFKSKKISDKIKKFIEDLKDKDNVVITYQDVLGYYLNGKRMVILTSQGIYSDYGRDAWKGEDDPKGYYVKCLLKNSPTIMENKIIDGEIYTFDRVFPDNFVGLFEELKELNKNIKSIPGVHPLNSEKRELRENYLAILVDKALADGNLSSNEVVRLEIISRQIGIDSITLISLIKDSMNRYDQYKESKEYILDSLKKMPAISKEYHYMLYHDLITFELLSNKGEVSEQCSDFSDIFAKRYSIEEKFRKTYTESMQKLVISSYALRNTICETEHIIEDKVAFDNLCESIDYEYNLQKELLK